MSVRAKTLVITGLALSLLLVVLYLAAHLVVLRGFADLEQRITRWNVERVAGLIEDDLLGLDVLESDWAKWDDTYEFVENRDPHYVQANLVANTLADLKLDFIVFTNSRGEVVAERGIDPANGSARSIPAGLREYLVPGSELIHHPNVDSKQGGILQLPEGLVLIVSRPILTSEGKGPIRGAILMGRFLSRDEVTRLEKRVGLQIAVSPVTASLTAADREARRALAAGEDIHARPVDARRIVGYKLLPDIGGRQAILLRVEAPRTAHLEGQSAILSFVLLLVGAGLAAGTAGGWVLNKTVLSRLARLSRNVRAMAERGQVRADRGKAKRDELAGLETAIEGMARLAEYDPLTDLPNRALFQARLAEALGTASEATERLAVLFLDLDRFKVINDALGHAAGDQLLRRVAERLKAAAPEGHLLARLGGDEFAVLAVGIVGHQGAAPAARRIRAALSPPFRLEGRELHVSASVGISVFPEDGSDAPTLMRNADAALFQAKDQGRDTYVFYTAGLNARLTNAMDLENCLRHALEAGELALYYQPQVSAADERVVGMEALLRWQHPEFGTIAPGQFVPLAEETGLIHPIGRWVLEQACAQQMKWKAGDVAPVLMSVNLSAYQLGEPDLGQAVARALADTGTEPHLLQLEITESAVMRDLDTSLRVLVSLRELGVSLALDDFGLGHSSLIYLKQLPVTTLKVDRAFVSGVATNPDDKAIVAAVVAMAHSLGLEVVAEGVETLEQLRAIRALGCDTIQGYLYSKPVPAEEAAVLLRQRVSVA